MIDPERMARAMEIPISIGSHDSIEDGACAMELASWVAGEPWSDHPECACPVIASFTRAWNDGLDDETRTRLMRGVFPRTIGTRSTPEVEERRAWLATDWLIRVLTPAFLSLSPVLREHADALSGLPPVTSRETAAASQPMIDAARDATLADAGDAWDAARAAAWAAARNAAWAAARAAAGAAAWDAARAAARAAAGAAAWDALRPTVKRLQTSALDLLGRMIEVRS